MVHFKNGFSLIELLVVIGLLSVTMMAVMSAINFQIDANKYVTVQSEINDTIYEAKVIMRDQANCDGNIANFTDVTFNINNLANEDLDIDRIQRLGPVPETLIQSGAPTAQGHQVQRIHLTNIANLATPTTFSGEVIVEFIPLGAKFAGGSLKRTFPLTFETAIAGNTATINSCFFGGGGAAADVSTALRAAVGEPTFPQYVICRNVGLGRNYIFHMGMCTPGVCQYRMLLLTGSSNSASYTAAGAIGNKTQQNGQGLHCPNVITLDGSSVQGP